MGFNPYRKYRANATDKVLVVAALVVCALLVAWALLG
jgi:hypothetical protein